MDYIISPLAIYLIKTVDPVRYLLFSVAAIGAFVLVITFSDVPEKWIRVGSAIILVSILLAVFTPSSETIIQMLVAKHITYDALASASDVVTQVYNDILNLFNN